MICLLNVLLKYEMDDIKYCDILCDIEAEPDIDLHYSGWW